MQNCTPQVWVTKSVATFSDTDDVHLYRSLEESESCWNTEGSCSGFPGFSEPMPFGGRRGGKVLRARREFHSVELHEIDSGIDPEMPHCGTRVRLKRNRPGNQLQYSMTIIHSAQEPIPSSEIP